MKAPGVWCVQIREFYNEGRFMAANIQLLVIDPQNSFCKVVPQDQQQVLHDGELCVPGAWDEFAVNDAGVCVLIDADDEVSAFKAAPGSHSRQVLTCSALDGSFTLWACGEKILASKGSVLYHVSKR